MAGIQGIRTSELGGLCSSPKWMWGVTLMIALQRVLILLCYLEAMEAFTRVGKRLCNPYHLALRHRLLTDGKGRRGKGSDRTG